MPVYALILDSFRESRDGKLFWILLVISVVVAGGLGCIGFDEKGLVLMFGLYQIPGSEFLAAGTEASRDFMKSLVTDVITPVYMGWVGIIACLIATSGIFPSFMQAGTVEALLGKPVSRWTIYLCKYVGSLLFVLVQASFFTAMTFLVVGWRADLWLWSFWWTVPLLVLLFSYLYCVCALFGVWTRRGLTSLMLTILFWIVCFAVQQTYMLFETEVGLQKAKTWHTVVRVLHTVTPKTSEVATINSKLVETQPASELAKAFEQMGGVEVQISDGDMEDIQKAEEVVAQVSPLHSIGTSLGFELVVLAFGAWRFSRKDF